MREASYLLPYVSPCLKLKLALVVLNVLRALPQSAAIHSHQPGRCGYLRAPATVRNPSSSNVVVIVLNVSKIQISLARETALLFVH